MRFLVLHGPNMRMLGIREPHRYGHITLEQLNQKIETEAQHLRVELAIHQSNHEGQLLDWLEEYRTLTEGCLFNPAGYTHTSVALLDGVLGYGKPVVEVHLTEPNDREPFRRVSHVGEGCAARFSGCGIESYLDGLRWLAANAQESPLPPNQSGGPPTS
ncbi:MAG: type II 3-dehydroquinate dehydratase [bacterium]